MLIMNLYYIHTEKYSPKSCVVNFDTQMSSSQSEEWTMVFTREKNDTSNQNRERGFLHVRKWYIQSEATEVCELRAKIPTFSCSLVNVTSHTFEERSFFLSQYVYNKHNTTRKVLRTVFTHSLFLICIRNLTRSLRSLVRFLIQKQLVCKYRMPALLSA